MIPLSSKEAAKPIAFCPATMCPLFAKDGSPWTGEIDAICTREECGWFHRGNCQGRTGAMEQVHESLVQIGPMPRVKSFNCPRAHECQWQIEAGNKLCPPRYALSKGVDPHNAAY